MDCNPSAIWRLRQECLSPGVQGQSRQYRERRKEEGGRRTKEEGRRGGQGGGRGRGKKGRGRRREGRKEGGKEGRGGKKREGEGKKENRGRSRTIPAKGQGQLPLNLKDSLRAESSL
jgi:hypothetical protein